jgi:putative N6-adenine-specific DNA methylase
MPRYFATVAKGIEPITAEELKRLGATAVEPTFGGVFFEGDTELLYRANLWLRTATRVLVPLRDFAAKTPEMLYDQVRRIKWEQLLNPDMTFAVDCTIAGSKSLRPREGERAEPRQQQYEQPRGLHHSKYAALKIKDAIVDQLRMKQGARPNVDTANPDVRVFAYLREGRCILSLDSSGASLHERGYRLEDAGAPLKETLAAAIIELSGWDPATPFIDPMCGSGTLTLEAAFKALDFAPGLMRQNFGFFGWHDFDEALWRKLLDEAQGRMKKRTDAPIVGFDRDRQAVAVALENAGRAHLTRAVHFERRELERLEPVGERPGTLIVNPPYGERLGDVEELKGLYGLLGDLFKQRMKGWTAFIFTGNLELAKSVGLRASRRHELFNGPIDCRLLKYELY